MLKTLKPVKLTVDYKTTFTYILKVYFLIHRHVWTGEWHNEMVFWCAQVNKYR